MQLSYKWLACAPIKEQSECGSRCVVVITVEQVYGLYFQISLLLYFAQILRGIVQGSGYNFLLHKTLEIYEEKRIGINFFFDDSLRHMKRKN